MDRKLLGAISVDFDITGQLLIIYLAAVKYLGKKQECNETENQLFIDLKKPYDSVTSEILYNILIEFCIPMKPRRLRKMCLNESYNTVLVGKHMSNTFPTTGRLTQADILSPLLFNFTLDYTIGKVLANQDGLKLNGTQQLLVYADNV